MEGFWAQTLDAQSARSAMMNECLMIVKILLEMIVRKEFLEVVEGLTGLIGRSSSNR